MALLTEKYSGAQTDFNKHSFMFLTEILQEQFFFNSSELTTTVATKLSLHRIIHGNTSVCQKSAYRSRAQPAWTDAIGCLEVSRVEQ
jgi:hypothetical protein